MDEKPTHNCALKYSTFGDAIVYAQHHCVLSVAAPIDVRFDVSKYKEYNFPG